VSAGGLAWLLVKMLSITCTMCHYECLNKVEEQEIRNNFLSVLFFLCAIAASNTKAEDLSAEHLMCTWCSTASDFRAFLDVHVIGRPSGAYPFYVGNPNNGELRYITAYVELQPEPVPPLIYYDIWDAEPALQQDFDKIVSWLHDETLVPVDPDWCGVDNCHTFETRVDTLILEGLRTHVVGDIIDELKTKRNWLLYHVLSAMGRYHSIILVFPNGDSVEVAIESLHDLPGDLVMLTETAVVINGNPIGGGSGGEHYVGGGGAAGTFILRVTGSGGETWYTCTSSNIPGSETVCVEDESN